MGLALGYLAWRNRRQIARAIADIIEQLRALWARLFGAGPAKPAGEEPGEASVARGAPPRPFASFANPFASSQHHSMPPDELIRYTFEAFEAWARERGFPRTPDQTPAELIRQAVPPRTPLVAESRHLARLYNEAAYAPGSVSATAAAGLAKLWALLHR